MKKHQCHNDCFVMTPFRLGWLLAGLVLFGIGFGLVEAVVVVDLRAILSPSAGRSDPLSAAELFPFTPIDRLGQTDPVAARLMKIEVIREAATLVLLAGLGLAVGRTFLQRFSAFLVAFAIWDLSYYLFLRWLLGWPASAWTWDILFLLPVPWVAPVLAPAIVAATMAVAGSAVIVWEASGRPFRVSTRDWTVTVLGGLLLITSFCWDWRNIASGGMPNPFPWPLFLAGEGIGLAGFLHSAWASMPRDRPAASARSPRDRTGAGQGLGGGIRGRPIQAEECEQVGDLLG
jgi:hypothetical protein